MRRSGVKRDGGRFGRRSGGRRPAGGSAGPSAGGWSGHAVRRSGIGAAPAAWPPPARRSAPPGGTRTATSRGSTTRGAGGAAAVARRRGLVGQLGVQRWRRSAFGGFGGAHHDPVSRRILHQMRGVARRDHAEIAGGLGQRRCGLRLEHVALECFLLLQQRLIGLAGIAQLVGAFGGIGRQPQRDAESEAQCPDHQHHERHPGGQGAGVQLDRRQLDEQPLAQRWADNLGRLRLSRLGPGLGLAGVLGPGGPAGGSRDRIGLGRRSQRSLFARRAAPAGWRF